MGRKRLLLILSAVLLLAAALYLLPKEAPDQEMALETLPDEEMPMGAPELPTPGYNSGYGITWSPEGDGASGFIGYTGDRQAASLAVTGTPVAEGELAPGITRAEAEKVLGSPMTSYGNTRIASLSNATKAFYRSGDDVVIVYYDLLDQSKAAMIVRINGQLAANTRFFTSSSLGAFAVEDSEAMTLDLINAVRLAHGKTALTQDPLVAVAARGHSQAMVSGNFFSHDNPNGQTMRDRLSAAGVMSKSAGEALTAGTWTPMDAVMAWMNSPPHRDILLGDYTAGAVGIASGSSAYGIYFTLNVVRY